MKDPARSEAETAPSPLQERLWRIIFLSDTSAGRIFDVVLLLLISASVMVVMLETVESVDAKYGRLLYQLEWTFTLLFSLEYLARLWVVRRPRRYFFSFFGIVDLLSILPTYLEILLTGSGHLMIIRILRLLRMFRILKMGSHIGEANLLLAALRGSRSKIAVFLFGVIAIVSIEGTLMYLLESGQEETGFTSIPQSIYWGIVTITTVGYGDITPVTVVGKVLASIMMLTGFAIIAVPTGIVGAELRREIQHSREDTRVCSQCAHHGHDSTSLFCRMCGAKLAPPERSGPG
jgi:voltage-gated potassium channel